MGVWFGVQPSLYGVWPLPVQKFNILEHPISQLQQTFLQKMSSSENML
jgi:hypothetical protein